MAQRERLKPFDTLAWVGSSDMEGSGARSVSTRLGTCSSGCPGLRALAGEPDAHAVAEELHPCGHDHVSHLQSTGDLRAVLDHSADDNGCLAHHVAHRVDDE